MGPVPALRRGRCEPIRGKGVGIGWKMGGKRLGGGWEEMLGGDVG